MQILRNHTLKLLTLLLIALLLSGCFAGSQKARVLERANDYFKAGEFDKAKVEYLNVLRLDNQNATAFKQLGFIWVEQGVPLRGIPFLMKVRELEPKNIAARTKLALALMAIAQTTEARKEAISILQQDPANSDALILLADTSQSKEEIAATEQQLDKSPQKNTAAFHIAAASLATRKGDVSTASDEIQQAVALEPKSARAHLIMGYTYLLRKNPGRAGPELKTAAELAPLRSEERIKYAEFQAANGASAEAKDLLQDVTRKAPDYLPAWRDLAQLALNEKKYDEALSFLENIFSRDPENPEARLIQADILLAKGEPAKATATLDRVNSNFPNNPLVKFALARSYIANGNSAQATAVLEQVVSLRPDYPEAVLALGALNLRSGKAQTVALAMEALLKKHPGIAQARALLAGAYESLGRLDDAAALYREQIKTAPESADAYFSLGLVLRQQKKNDEAYKAFEKSSELAPNNLAPLDQLVDMDIADKKYDAATARVEELLQKNPNGGAPHFLQGKIFAAQGGPRDLAQAEQSLQKAIDLDSNLTPAYELLVSVYLAQNKFPQAISQLKAELDKNPKDPRPPLMTGIIYERMKDYQKARDAYEKVLALNPDSVLALNNLAYLYAERLNQLDKGYELAQKARTLQPGDGRVADTLGWILYKRGDYQQALALTQESASKYPDNPEVQFHLGMTSYMMGQADAARAALERVVHAPGDFPGKDEAKRRLALLEQSAGQESNVPAGDLEALLKQQPNDPMVVNRAAGDYEKRGEFAKAAATYEQALKLNPKLLTAALKLAELYAGPLQQRDQAIEFAKKARALAPTDPQTAGVLGHIALEAGNFSWAYSLLQESSRKAGDNFQVLYDLGMSAYALGKVPEARQAIERSLKAAPDAAQAKDANQFLAMTGRDQKSAQAGGGDQEVQAVLKTQPDYVPALMLQAASRKQQNDLKAAADIYLNVLRKYPDFAPAQKELAIIYSDDPDNVTKAYDLAMKARKTIPDDPELARTLAELSFRRKEFPYAIQLFQESAAKQPLPANDLYYLGIAQLQSRQQSKGRESLQRALAAGLQEPLAQEAKQRLAQEQPK